LQRPSASPLAADLQALDAEQWQAASLCSQWTVRDGTTHMTATAKITPPAFFTKPAMSRFNFGRLQDKDVTAEKGASPTDTLARFDAVVNSEKRPPGPIDSWLAEAILHAEDIRRPLAIQHAAGHRRRLVPWQRARGVGTDHAAGHGHDRRKAALDNLTGDASPPSGHASSPSSG
jgi:uncharacterized protein (TIGR03083 family)